MIPIFAILFLGALDLTQGAETEYFYKGFQDLGDPATMVLVIRPTDVKRPIARQEEEDEDDEPSTTPFIPQVIPGVTKIFNGLLTGNLNEIFHGSTSFAPKNVSYAIDTVYNQVVGIPPPVTTVPTTPTTPTVAPLIINGTVVNPNATAAPVQVAQATTPLIDDDDEEEAARDFNY